MTGQGMANQGKTRETPAVGRKRPLSASAATPARPRTADRRLLCVIFSAFLAVMTFGCGDTPPKPPESELADRQERHETLLAECGVAFEDAAPYGHDFCRSLVDRWVSGGLTTEDFISELGRLRPLPLPMPAELE